MALFLLAAAPSHGADDLSTLPVDKLIDALTEIDSQAPGLHPTAWVTGFIGDDKPLDFAGGVLGSHAPIVPPQMRELARRGPSALPALINHLNDARPTKLTVGAGFFMFRYFSNEYDPKSRSRNRSMIVAGPDKNSMRKPFTGGYTVKVGDVCYAIIGQIVNRQLWAVRYQPSAGLIINSPIEVPALIDEVKQDWAGLDPDAHKASLIADAQSGTIPWTFAPALARLRFYYPDAYAQLKTGALAKRITAFESDEATQAHGAKGSG